jgi:hypothetical protein
MYCGSRAAWGQLSVLAHPNFRIDSSAWFAALLSVAAVVSVLRTLLSAALSPKLSALANSHSDVEPHYETVFVEQGARSISCWSPLRSNEFGVTVQPFSCSSSCSAAIQLSTSSKPTPTNPFVRRTGGGCATAMLNQRIVGRV